MTASGADPVKVINAMIHDPEVWKKFGVLDEEQRHRPDWFLALGDLSGFSYARLTIGETLVTAAPEIVYLLVLNLIFFLVAFMRFARYDVR